MDVRTTTMGNTIVACIIKVESYYGNEAKVEGTNVTRNSLSYDFNCNSYLLQYLSSTMLSEFVINIMALIYLFFLAQLLT